MKLANLIQCVFDEQFADGLFVRLRHAFPNPLRMLRALHAPRSQRMTITLPDRIAVVGIGTAALVCLRELKREGFERVTVIARDDRYGGKCVNTGCMPSAFVLAAGDAPPEKTRAALAEFVVGLRADVARQFLELGYPIVIGDIKAVQGSRLIMHTGDDLEFDKLIVAMGNDFPLPSLIPGTLPKLTTLEQFWNLPTGSKVAIYADGNVSALALGDVAVGLGLKPTVLLAGANPYASLPSYRYFVREMSKRGVRIYERSRLLRVDSARIDVDAGGKHAGVEYDALLIASKPLPRFPVIDGMHPTLYDIDLTHATLPERPDIVFLGDGGGYFTASEAENQAKLLVRAWKCGERLDFGTFESAPTSIHGVQSLAMTGPTWLHGAGEWNEIDFRALGWSHIHELDGKLWYVLDQRSRKLSCLHICHRDACELIGLGAALMEFSVDNPRWLTCSIHPSATEIFKVLADDAIARLPSGDESNRLTAKSEPQLRFALPPTAHLHPSDTLPGWVNREQCIAAITSRRPREYFAACYGAAKLRDISCLTITPPLVTLSDGSIGLAEPGDLQLSFDAPNQVCVLEMAEWRIEVCYGNHTITGGET